MSHPTSLSLSPTSSPLSLPPTLSLSLSDPALSLSEHDDVPRHHQSQQSHATGMARSRSPSPSPAGLGLGTPPGTPPRPRMSSSSKKQYHTIGGALGMDGGGGGRKKRPQSMFISSGSKDDVQIIVDDVSDSKKPSTTDDIPSTPERLRALKKSISGMNLGKELKVDGDRKLARSVSAGNWGVGMNGNRNGEERGSNNSMVPSNVGGPAPGRMALGSSIPRPSSSFSHNSNPALHNSSTSSSTKDHHLKSRRSSFVAGVGSSSLSSSTSTAAATPPNVNYNRNSTNTPPPTLSRSRTVSHANGLSSRRSSLNLGGGSGGAPALVTPPVTPSRLRTTSTLSRPTAASAIRVAANQDQSIRPTSRQQHQGLDPSSSSLSTSKSDRLHSYSYRYSSYPAPVPELANQLDSVTSQLSSLQSSRDEVNLKLEMMEKLERRNWELELRVKGLEDECEELRSENWALVREWAGRNKRDAIEREQSEGLTHKRDGSGGVIGEGERERVPSPIPDDDDHSLTSPSVAKSAAGGGDGEEKVEFQEEGKSEISDDYPPPSNDIESSGTGGGSRSDTFSIPEEENEDLDVDQEQQEQEHTAKIRGLGLMLASPPETPRASRVNLDQSQAPTQHPPPSQLSPSPPPASSSTFSRTFPTSPPQPFPTVPPTVSKHILSPSSSIVSSISSISSSSKSPPPNPSIPKPLDPNIDSSITTSLQRISDFARNLTDSFPFALVRLLTPHFQEADLAYCRVHSEMLQVIRGQLLDSHNQKSMIQQPPVQSFLQVAIQYCFVKYFVTNLVDSFRMGLEGRLNRGLDRVRAQVLAGESTKNYFLWRSQTYRALSALVPEDSDLLRSAARDIQKEITSIVSHLFLPIPSSDSFGSANSPSTSSPLAPASLAQSGSGKSGLSRPAHDHPLLATCTTIIQSADTRAQITEILSDALAAIHVRKVGGATGGGGGERVFWVKKGDRWDERKMNTHEVLKDDRERKDVDDEQLRMRRNLRVKTTVIPGVMGGPKEIRERAVVILEKEPTSSG